MICLIAMIDQLLSLLVKLPLNWLVLVGSFLEELIAPIPSPFVMTTAALSGLQMNYTFLDFLILATIGAVGKTTASLIIYMLADKTEDLLASKLGRLSGVTHTQIEQLGKLLNYGWWDDIILLLLRSAPFIPSFLISVGAGVLKIKLRTYIITTFLGTIVRNGFYLFIGIYGIEQVMVLWRSSSWALLVLLLMGALAVIVGYLTFKDRLSAKLLQSNNMLPVQKKKSGQEI